MSHHWNLAPRYTAGSPAAVWDEKLARRVAAEEKEDYERTLEGVYGEPAKARAQEMGLGGIVEERVEFRGGWRVVDLITGRRFVREKRLAQKLRYGDIVTRYQERNGRETAGAFKVLEVTRFRQTGMVGVGLEGGPGPRGVVFIPEGYEVTVEKDEVAP